MSRNLEFGLIYQQPNSPSQGLNRSLNQECNVGGRPWWEWILLCVTFLNSVCFFGFTIVDLIETFKNSQFDEIMAQTIGSDQVFFNTTAKMINPSFSFDLIALVALVMAPFLFLYGMLAEKKYEICLSPIILSIAVLFCIPEVIVNKESILWQKIARVLVCGFLTLVSLPLTHKMVSENTWFEFTIAGTSDRLLGMYRRVCYFTALLKLDFFIIMILGVFCLRAGMQSSTDFIFMAFLWVYGICCLAIGTAAVNWENAKLVFTFIALGVPLPLWITYEVMRFNCFLPDHCFNNMKLIAFGALAAGILASVMKIYIWIELLKVYRNFGFGLTDAAFVGLVTCESSSLLGRQRRQY